jgi:protein arginine N-methyltransferase 5
MQVSITIDRSLQLNDLQREIELKRKVKVQSICIPVFHSRLPDDLTCNNDAVTRSDRAVASFRDWNENFIGRMTYWMDIDSKDGIQCKLSKERFDSELSYCSHLGLKKVILPPLVSHRSSCCNYAQTVMKYVNSSMNTLLRLQKLLIPLAFLDVEESSFETLDESLVLSNWNTWNKLQQHIDYCPSVGLIMEVTNAVDDFVKYFFYADVDYLNSFLQRWMVEPLVSIQISFSSFIFNSHGFPVLPKHLQYLLQYFMKLSVGVVIVGNPAASYESYKHSLPVNDSEDDSDVTTSLYQTFVQYLRYLQKKTEEEMLTEDEKNCYSYFDVLQLPLQPLMDNLDSNTYEVFERDSIKYVKYERAVEKALKEIVERKQQQNSDSSAEVEVMVVGCGRGPLIAATLSASSNCNIPVKIIGIEKNPNAIITLQNRMKMEYWDPKRVTIISKDMRRYYAEKKCDLIVSELLGSFGDNELSPECLYNCEHNFHQNTISIPTSYTSYLQPISSPLLYVAAREAFSHYPSTLSSASVSNSARGLETPFVVLMKRFLTLADPKSCWNFHHPSFCDPEQMHIENAGGDGEVDTKR